MWTAYGRCRGALFALVATNVTRGISGQRGVRFKRGHCEKYPRKFTFVVNFDLQFNVVNFPSDTAEQLSIMRYSQ